MDKISALCEEDRKMLYEFSRRSIGRLSGRSLVYQRLPFLRAYMDANVEKEVEKDRLIIESAAGAFASGASIGDIFVEEVFEKTKEMDRAFIRKMSIPSIFIHVRYEDIAETRKERILYISRAVSDLLHIWDDRTSFSDAVKKAYSEGRFREVVSGILHLYNMETKLLSRSIRLFAPIHLAMDLFAETLYDIMEEAAADMAEECAGKIYGGVPESCQGRI